MSRPARRPVAVSSSFATAKRSSSSGSPPDERAHHADAGDLLAQDAVHPVDALPASARNSGISSLAGSPISHHQGTGRPAPRRPGQAEVLLQRKDDAADDRDRGADHQCAGHDHQHLHLLDVVRASRDQRGRTEVPDLARAEVTDPREQRASADPGRTTSPSCDAEEHGHRSLQSTWSSPAPRASPPRCAGCSRCCPAATPLSMISPLRVGR